MVMSQKTGGTSIPVIDSFFKELQSKDNFNDKPRLNSLFLRGIFFQNIFLTGE